MRLNSQQGVIKCKLMMTLNGLLACTTHLSQWKKNHLKFCNNFSAWESQHGCLLGLKVAVGVTSPDRDSQFHLEVRQMALRYLTHQEVRVRQAAGQA